MSFVYVACAITSLESSQHNDSGDCGTGFPPNRLGEYKAKVNVAESRKNHYIVAFMPRTKRRAENSELLKEWVAIARLRGLTPAITRRWARGGMPLRREGRFTVAERGKVARMAGKESGMPNLNTSRRAMPTFPSLEKI